MNKEQIIEKLLEVLEKEEILSGYKITDKNFDDNLETHGMDSFSFVKLLVKLEEVFCIEIPNEFLVYDKWGTINIIVCSLDEIINAN